MPLNKARHLRTTSATSILLALYIFSQILSWFIFCILTQSQLLKMEQKDGEEAAAHEPQCGFPPEVWGHCFSLLEDVRDRVAVAAVPSPRCVNQ
jgi:hypothetical protein